MGIWLNKSAQKVLGLTFGKLTVKNYSHTQNGKLVWNCVCNCGRETKVMTGNLTGGNSTSCGICIASERHKIHGHSRGGPNGLFTPEYAAWSAMRTNVYNKKSASYRNIGGRGIKIYKYWDNFETFLASVGYKPEGDYVFTRIDWGANYIRSNVQWVPRAKFEEMRKAAAQVGYDKWLAAYRKKKKVKK